MSKGGWVERVDLQFYSWYTSSFIIAAVEKVWGKAGRRCSLAGGGERDENKPG